MKCQGCGRDYSPNDSNTKLDSVNEVYVSIWSQCPFCDEYHKHDCKIEVAHYHFNEE